MVAKKIKVDSEETTELTKRVKKTTPAKVLSSKDQWVIDNINKQLETQTNAKEINRLNAQKEALLN